MHEERENTPASRPSDFAGRTRLAVLAAGRASAGLLRDLDQPGVLHFPGFTFPC